MSGPQPPAAAAPAPHELLDDGYAPPACRVVVVGCGNLLRGDDAVGPIALKTLWHRGVADDVRLVDGGTAGMDVAFQMRGAGRAILIDAATTGAAPGTIYRIPGEEVGALPPLDGLHTHAFRWDHALAFGTWLLGPEFPADVTVFLIEAQGTEPGAELSAVVRAAMEEVVALVAAELEPDARPAR